MATSESNSSTKGTNPPPELPPVLEKGLNKLGELTTSITSAMLRKDKDRLYSTLEDFRRSDPELKRLVVVGCTGAGKSTLLNVMAGWRYVQRPPEYEFEWEAKDPSKESTVDGKASPAPLFEASAGNDSVTKKSSFANIDWCGDEAREVIVMDTPGHDDTAGADIDSSEAREALGAIAADLHNKLKALRTIHAILVLHNDIHSNRLNPATYTILKMIDEKFSKAGHSVWNHVVVGYSKCNHHETSWRSGLAKKIPDLQQSIRSKIPGCDVDVPVFALGGGTIEPPPPAGDTTDSLEELWQFIEAAKPLDTSSLQPFEGPDVKWQKLVNEKDEAEARAKAAIIYVAVMIKLAMLAGIFFWRRYLLPGWMGAILLDFSGLYDELLIVGGFIFWLGPMDVLYSAKHFYLVWVKPSIEERLGPYMGKTKAD